MSDTAYAHTPTNCKQTPTRGVSYNFMPRTRRLVNAIMRTFGKLSNRQDPINIQYILVCEELEHPDTQFCPAKPVPSPKPGIYRETNGASKTDVIESRRELKRPPASCILTRLLLP